MELEKYFDRHEDLLLNAADIAARLRISKRFAYFLMATHAIRTLHLGRSVRVRQVDLDAYLDSLSVTAQS